LTGATKRTISWTAPGSSAPLSRTFRISAGFSIKASSHRQGPPWSCDDADHERQIVRSRLLLGDRPTVDHGVRNDARNIITRAAAAVDRDGFKITSHTA